MSKEDKKATRAKIDWEAIEKDWRAGIKSVLQIAKEHEISHTAINKRFKKLNVERNLAGKIRAKADALVSASVVSAKVSTETKLEDVEIIEANAQVQANIVIGHRSDIQRSRTLSMSLLYELEAETKNPELFEQLGELMIGVADENSKASADRTFKLQQAFDKVMSLPGRVDAAKKLAETLKVLIALEREAFGLDAGVEPEKPVKQLTNDELTGRINGILNKVRGLE